MDWFILEVVVNGVVVLMGRVGGEGLSDSSFTGYGSMVGDVAARCASTQNKAAIIIFSR